MTDFNLDGEERFNENCTAFLASMKEIDPEMAAILESNWDNLLAVVREGKRDTKSRTTFNETIAIALDELLTNEVEPEGE
ncbi:hypothetical protein FZX02_06145 [Synechococcus sp. MU1644]|nr:hypothetical protein [Synechococcus sp. MU1644]